MATLVTGGAGFVGLNVVEELATRGETVIVLDRLALPPTLGDGGRVTTVVGDVEQPDDMGRLFRDHAIDRVIHAAAITADRDRESRDAGKIFGVNLSGTLNVLAAAKDHACKRVIYVGSGAAYGQSHRNGTTLFEESSASRPNDLYSISKYAAERAALRLSELWKIDVICVRLGSVFGPWEFDSGVRDMLSPHFQAAQMAIRGQTAIVPRTEPWRDWIYSRDVAAGLVETLMVKSAKHDLYHVGCGGAFRSDFAEFCDALAASYPQFSWRIAGENEQANINFVVSTDRSPMDTQRLATDIGFRPRFLGSVAYADYITWMRSHEALFQI